MKAIIIEDDKLLAARIASFISEKFESEICYDGEEGLEKVKKNKYNLIIIDSILPKVNAIKLLKKLKEWNLNIPTAVLTFSASVEDKLEIIDYALAEYFFKSGSKEEFLIIIDNLMQRFKNQKDTNTISYGNIRVDILNETAYYNDEILENIKGKYLDLLYFFILNNNIILKKEEIFDRVWGVNSETTMNAIEVYISGLRKELKKVGCENYIKTIRGIGYSLA
ncbi:MULTISPECIES: response regulator transcription factor [unclassified Gemella]|uniref:response regulator transcription factor n=1 Tax=unclassified Gemella TaxID=2624949 RepID=UPI001C04349C|nr:MULTISPECIES: response regulator transcription factor [unclassified Gemella]MBU0279100.1 response regulator transcription factor [Gemella sp. zg-1178]QWQ39177.1 response regulator transcription factor [Gemella sp. zg-570]